MRALAMLPALLLACSGHFGGDTEHGGQQRVTVRGSDTFVVLVQRWAERYAKDNPGVSVEVSGGGTGTGIAALTSGTTDVATASRSMTPSERRSIEKLGPRVVETVVALDAIAIYVHESNPIETFDVATLKNVFRGKANDWSELGGRSAPIVLYSRESSSGTYAYFKEHVLEKEDFAAEAQALPGTAAVVQAVAHDPNAVGYGGVASATRGVRVVAIRTAKGVFGPTLENARSGRYPLSRPLFVYTRSDASPSVTSFVAWLTGAEAQELAQGAGFFPRVEP